MKPLLWVGNELDLALGLPVPPNYDTDSTDSRGDFGECRVRCQCGKWAN